MSDRDTDSETEALRRHLRDLAEGAPGVIGGKSDEDFRASLHRRLVAAGPPPRLGLAARLRDALDRWRSWVWPAAGIAAGAATFGLLVIVRGVPAPVAEKIVHVPAASAGGASEPVATTSSVPHDVTPTYDVPSSKVAVIKLNFTAEVAVEDVTFEVTLPEGLAFWSRGQSLPDRTFRWPGRLGAGDNLVPIAVRSGRPGRYHVRAKVLAAGETLEHEVILQVKGEAI